MATRETYQLLKTMTALMVGAWITSAPLTHAATVGGSGVSIHRYADFNQQALALEGKSVAMTATHAAAQRTQISIYGKQLTLRLEDHSALLGAASPLPLNINLLRGTIEGAPHSWLRLTRVASGTHGLIWDGTDLYAIEPSAEVGTMLDQSLPVPTGSNIIFKLADTSVDLGGNYCAAGDHINTTGINTTNTGLATYRALTAELSQQNNNDSAPILRLELQVLADAAFRAEYTSDQAALAALIVRLNNIDGIYSAQLGLAVQATDIQLFAHDPAALSTSTDTGTLLNSLGQLRANTPGMSSYAATHLFTGRDLDGDTLGIAYIGNLCGARYAASLSEVRNRGAWIDSLVAAHELGHQLGAVHDGTGACSDSAADGYLMSSFINGSDAFSSCSRDSILATMQYAACLVPISTPDIGGVIDGPASNAPPAPAAQSGGGALTAAWLLIFSTLVGWRRRQLHRCAA
jgi:Metallo-peptidase family M12